MIMQIQVYELMVPPTAKKGQQGRAHDLHLQDLPASFSIRLLVQYLMILASGRTRSSSWT